MKKVWLCFVITIFIVVFLFDEISVYSQSSPLKSPIFMPHAPEMPTPTIVPTIEPTPQIPDEQNQSIDLDDTYGNMLNLVQQERLWPVGEPRYDGCVALSDGSWICP